MLDTHEHQLSQRESTNMVHLDAKDLQPYFPYQDPTLILRTLHATTRFAREPMGRPILHQTYQSPFPASNVLRRNEPVATNTIKASCNSLDDVIRYRGAMDTFISNRGSNEISTLVRDILRALHIVREWTSEAHYQHQNHAERCYRDLKTTTNLLFQLHCCPAESWVYCLQYVAYILNHTATRSIGWRTPIEKLTGSTPDISAITRFRFWEPVYFSTHDPYFPSDSTEMLGHFLRFAHNVGHSLTFHVLNLASGRVLQRSQLRSATIPGQMNTGLPKPPTFPITETVGDPIPLCVPFPTIPPPDTSEAVDNESDNNIDDDTPSTSMDDFDPLSLIGRTFLSSPRADGQRFRSRIADILEDQEFRAQQDQIYTKFRCVRDADESEEIPAYHEFAMALEEELEDDGIFKFRAIRSHQCPFSKADPE
eukprot:Nitzschia sp. Nitz4//scaffold568_size2940//1121//2491//NITZ4_009283-RA/size2940-processed-gene-0.4-mRNA-1//-1//CDS//3329554641//5138//frame0